MTLLLTFWIVSLVGLIGTISLRSWQIKTGRVNPERFDPETENPLSPTRIEFILRKVFISVRDHSRAIFIRVLHALALFTHRARITLDRLVRKMVARIEHEQGVLEANRRGEQFLSAISEYKETLRQTAQDVKEEVQETVAEVQETVAEVVEVVKKPAVRRKRKPKVTVETTIELETPKETATEIPQTEEDRVQ